MTYTESMKKELADCEPPKDTDKEYDEMFKEIENGHDRNYCKD